MEPKLQRRIQRYGWDLAAATYEPHWQAQLAPAQTELLARVAPVPGERVLDVACGTGLVTFDAARAVGAAGRVVGVDISEQMVDTARRRARERGLSNVEFARMAAESFTLPDAGFDVVMCALGLMYVPEPERAVREALRVLRPGGRLGFAVWGERARCGWAPVFPIVDAEVVSEVCPLFFRLGQVDVLAGICGRAKLEAVEQYRIDATLSYADADKACDAVFVAGPVALAWSHFSAAARSRVRARYVEAIEPWRSGEGYRIPAEFVIVTAVAPA